MTSPEGQAVPWQSKTYVAILADPRNPNQATITVEGHGPASPLPFVDSHEHGRRFYGETTPVTPEANRTFHHGYGGAGPRETAASILADHFGGVPQPPVLVQAFKWDVLARFAQGQGWRLTGAQVQAWVERHRFEFRDAWQEVEAREAEEAELTRLQALEDEELGRG